MSAIPPKTQFFLAKRAGAHISEVKSSRVPQMRRPLGVYHRV